MGDRSELQRHARHLALSQVGADGQGRIERASALLVGAGGIGCAVATYLVASGIGRLVICDFDTVDATNLGRQVLYGPDDIGRLKVEVVAEKLGRINPDSEIVPIPERLDDARLAVAVREVDLVLDGSDNFATRFQVNDACVGAGRCLISGAAIRLEGQVAVFGPDYGTTPCYRCLYRQADESLENCAGNGVLATVPGVVGTLMATEALKYLAGIGGRRGVLRLFDAGSDEVHSLRVAKRADCETCA